MNILNDEEIDALDCIEMDEFDYIKTESIQKFAHAIEAAILKKIGGPVAWHHDDEGLSYENHYAGNVPLYRLPTK